LRLFLFDKNKAAPQKPSARPWTLLIACPCSRNQGGHSKMAGGFSRLISTNMPITGRLSILWRLKFMSFGKKRQGREIFNSRIRGEGKPIEFHKSQDKQIRYQAVAILMSGKARGTILYRGTG
jgi:hypothetical protein